MKLQSIHVSGLQGTEHDVTLKFNSDLNIVTGRNGAGKTTILKLIWYILSGNIELAFSEIHFNKAQLTTDEYTIILSKMKNKTDNASDITISITYHNDSLKEEIEVESHSRELRMAERYIHTKIRGNSVFFPTFRRIEGGFSTQNSRRIYRESSGLQRALSELSDELSNENHIFVSSLSTSDIELLLIKKHSELSEKYNHLQSENSNHIINRIKQNSDNSDNEKAKQTLNLIQEEIQRMEQKKQEIMQPFETLKNLVSEFFKHSGIKLNKMNLSFGDAANAINSDLLSAGEKQMFSFIAYNTFYHDTIFIIDEPELSLHIDWQRTLFPMLLKQGTSNQFIVATHSPFIYGKYPDKELQLISDRGDCENVEE